MARAVRDGTLQRNFQGFTDDPAEVLIGMGATILDHAVVQKGCLVGAGSVVTERSVLEAGWLYAGIPARKIKLVGEDRQELMKRTAIRYPEYGKMYSISESPDAENENR
jgi:carbonic anhydrase/acetyltransferase-like protein (isoleucine patch superfamily)